jgi:Tol biopolymer transport system component
MKFKYFSFILSFCIYINVFFVKNTIAQDYKVTWGNEKVLTLDNTSLPDLSPDGTKLLFIKYIPKATDKWEGHLWVSNNDGSFARNLIFSQNDIDSGNTYDIIDAIWSPDNNTIVYHQLGGFGPDEIKVTKASTSGGGPRLIQKSQLEKRFVGWWPDGSKFLFNLGDTTYVADSKGSNQKLFGEDIGDVSFAPGATTIVYFENGKLIFLYPNGTEKYQKSLPDENMSNPIWAPNGKYIILGKYLYVIATGDLIPFLPDSLFIYQENGKNYKGPACITLSKNGKKFAFDMSLEGGSIYQSKIKIIDLTWKD